MEVHMWRCARLGVSVLVDIGRFGRKLFYRFGRVAVAVAARALTEAGVAARARTERCAGVVVAACAAPSSPRCRRRSRRRRHAVVAAVAVAVR